MRDWVQRAEIDHVVDIGEWAGKGGYSTAKTLEDVQKSYKFESQEDCEGAAKAAMSTRLSISFSSAYNRTRIEHDLSGKHTWGSRNQRP